MSAIQLCIHHWLASAYSNTRYVNPSGGYLSDNSETDSGLSTRTSEVLYLMVGLLKMQPR